MTTQQAKTRAPLKLHAAFSGAAAELLDSDVDVMGRGLEPVVMLYEGDITPDRVGSAGGKFDGTARLLSWDWMTLVHNVRRMVPDVNYAGWICVNVETVEESLNPTTLAAMKDIIATICNERPRAKVGWYGHPRRFIWPHLNGDKGGNVDRYCELFQTMGWLEALTPHHYPVGELVQTRGELLKERHTYLQEDMALAITRQVSLVNLLANDRKNGRPVLWFVTPFVCRPGDPEGDYTCNRLSKESFAAWVKMLREAGVDNMAIWMHATPGEAEQLERVRKALVEVVFAGVEGTGL
jgi:hypothetical protein